MLVSIDSLLGDLDQCRKLAGRVGGADVRDHLAPTADLLPDLHADGPGGGLGLHHVQIHHLQIPLD